MIRNIILIVTFFFFFCKREERLPNIVLIVADDLGYADIGISNLAEDVYTPNIDRLAKMGFRFTNAYNGSPICSPSRATIMTGCYPQRLGAYWYSSPGLKDKKYATIAELLKKKDYKTGYIGKVHYGNYDRDTSNRSFPKNHGFDYFFGHTSARKHYMHHKQDIEDAFLKVKKEYKRTGQSLRQGPLWRNTKKVDTLAFLTNLIGDESVKFINDNSKNKFFLQIAFNAAHNFTHQLPEEYLEKNNLKGYHDWDPAKDDYYKWYKKGRYPNNDEGRDHFLGQVKYMDEQIGLIINELEKNNLLENTLIFFISDNGGSTPIYANNYPLKGSKYLLYEGGIRSQMIVSYPKKYKKNEIKDNMVSAMDILPTICNEVGITPPKHIDGINISPILNGKNPKLSHEVLFWDTKHEIAIRKGNWKLRKAFSDRHAKYEMVDLELGDFLYNLKDDIGENNNLIKKNSEIESELMLYYMKWKAYIDGDEK